MYLVLSILRLEAVFAQIFLQIAHAELIFFASLQTSAVGYD